MACFPAGVVGPVECCAFFRLASFCLSEISILDLPFPGLGRGARPQFQGSGRVGGKCGVSVGCGAVSGVVALGCGAGIYYLGV
jgi:hypothetical protein